MFFLWTSGWCSSSIFVLQACTIYVVVEPLVSKKTCGSNGNLPQVGSEETSVQITITWQFCNCDLFGMGRWPFQTSSGIQQGVKKGHDIESPSRFVWEDLLLNFYIHSPVLKSLGCKYSVIFQKSTTTIVLGKLRCVRIPQTVQIILFCIILCFRLFSPLLVISASVISANCSWHLSLELNAFCQGFSWVNHHFGVTNR